MLKERHGIGALLMMGGALAITGFLLAGILCLGATVGAARHGDATGMILVGTSLAIAALGLLLMGSALVYGIWLDRNRFKGPLQTLSPVYVVAAYALEKRTQATVPLWSEYPPDQLRFFVRLRLPDRTDEEFECAPEVFQTVGEGTTGEAVVKGKWLCQFTVHSTGSQPLYDIYEDA